MKCPRAAMPTHVAAGCSKHPDKFPNDLTNSFACEWLTFHLFLALCQLYRISDVHIRFGLRRWGAAVRLLVVENMRLLTFSDDQGWVEQEVPHQLCGQLVEEAAGDRAVKNHILVLHRVHQRDWWRAWLLGHALDLKIHANTHIF